MDCPYCGSSFTVSMGEYPYEKDNKKVKVERCLICQSNIVIEHEKYIILKS